MFRNYKICGYNHCVELDKDLTKEEENSLKSILSFLPNGDKMVDIHHFIEKDFSEYNKNYDKYLLKVAANSYDNLGTSVLGLACISGRLNAVQKLIDLGADINKLDGLDYRPIFYALKYTKSTEIVKCLINNGADINLPCENDLKPIQVAKNNDFTSVFNLLIKPIEIIETIYLTYNRYRMFRQGFGLLPKPILNKILDDADCNATEKYNNQYIVNENHKSQIPAEVEVRKTEKCTIF